MTESYSNYSIQFETISNDIVTHLEQISADDIIDLNEADETKTKVKAWKKSLSALKKKVRLEIRKIRTEYKPLIAKGSYGTLALRQERDEKIKALWDFAW